MKWCQMLQDRASKRVLTHQLLCCRASLLHLPGCAGLKNSASCCRADSLEMDKLFRRFAFCNCDGHKNGASCCRAELQDVDFFFSFSFLLHLCWTQRVSAPEGQSSWRWACSFASFLTASVLNMQTVLGAAGQSNGMRTCFSASLLAALEFSDKNGGCCRRAELLDVDLFLSFVWTLQICFICAAC